MARMMHLRPQVIHISYYDQCNKMTGKRLASTVSRNLPESVKAGKLTYFGHIMRKKSESLEKQIMQGTTPGSGTRGRLKTTWMDNVTVEWSPPRIYLRACIVYVDVWRYWLSRQSLHIAASSSDASSPHPPHLHQHQHQQPCRQLVSNTYMVRKCALRPKCRCYGEVANLSQTCCRLVSDTTHRGSLRQVSDLLRGRYEETDVIDIAFADGHFWRHVL